MKKLIKTNIIIIGIALSLLIGCGDSDSGNKNTTVTTLPCSNKPHTINNGQTWQYSQTDTRACNLLVPTTTAFCNSNQIKVRIDSNYNNYRNRYVNSNYHSSPNGYEEVCLNQGDNRLDYIIWTGSYYYVDQPRLYSTWTYQRQHYHHLSANEALIGLGILGTFLLLAN